MLQCPFRLIFDPHPATRALGPLLHRIVPSSRADNVFPRDRFDILQYFFSKLYCHCFVMLLLNNRRTTAVQYSCFIVASVTLIYLLVFFYLFLIKIGWAFHLPLFLTAIDHQSCHRRHNNLRSYNFRSSLNALFTKISVFKGNIYRQCSDHR